jgi:acetolactate synthase-1/2/3 large subunit
MKLTDYVVQRLAEAGVTQVFGLTGGAVVHLLDSAARQPGLTTTFMHHEQAVAFAAQAAARVHNDLAVAMVTTGPGGTNALTGLAAAWLDSVPCLYISGQVRLAHAKPVEWLRQVGTQHLDIVALTKPMTKRSVMLTEASQIRYELECAIWTARSGRPGPVWLDIPLDLQWAEVDPESMAGFTPPDSERVAMEPAEADIEAVVALLAKSSRPLFLLGYGVRLSGGGAAAVDLMARTGLPYVTSWNTADLFPADAVANLGRPGVFGQRGANLAVQNCDLLIAVGSHLCLSITGGQTAQFARAADIVMVNIDPNQLTRATVRVDLAVQSDAARFLVALSKRIGALRSSQAWADYCAVLHHRYSWVIPPLPGADSPASPYSLMDSLSRRLPDDALIVVDGGGTVNQIAFQSLRTHPGQRLLISSGLCSMGSGLPDAVGACMQSGRRPTVCLNGDGSLQLNIQEFQTLVHHRLPVTVFVLCNDGYTSIRQTQDGFLGGRHLGSEASGGMSLPNYAEVGRAYGLRVVTIDTQGQLEAGVAEALSQSGPTLCLVRVAPDFKPEPRQGFIQQANGTFAAQPLEDMYPFLPRDEFNSLMCIAPV